MSEQELSEEGKAILERIRNPIVYRRIAILETLCGCKKQAHLEPTFQDIHVGCSKRISSADLNVEPLAVDTLKIRTFRFLERRRHPRQRVEMWRYLEVE